MANYVVTTYSTEALFEAAIEVIATSGTFKAISYREGCTDKFLTIVPDPRAAA